MSTKDNINAIRFLGAAAINKANSGHPGIVLGAAPIAYTLYSKFLNADPTFTKWVNRDRFVLSAGHGSALLYSILHLYGYGMTIQDLKNFRQLESVTPGHPEYGLTYGVEATTGPLGQGVAMGVGMAIAECHLGSIYNKPDIKLIDHYTYVLCGDGDLQEGVCQEAIAFAGRNKLNKMILIHDSNDIQLDSEVKCSTVTDYQKLFSAYSWNTILVKDGENVEEIEKAIATAKKSKKPTYIEVKTIIGFGAPKQGTCAVHGEPLRDDLTKAKEKLGWKYNDFEIPEFIYNDFIKVKEKNIHNRELWDIQLAKYEKKYPELAKKLMMSIKSEYDINFKDFDELAPIKPEATRTSSGKIFSKLSELNSQIIGGSADLSVSTKIKGADGQFSLETPQGRNIMYGVREFGMGAINNGIALHGGLLPTASGFFIFSDYLKPSIRLAALMGLHVLYVFTHDSIAVGEDGPTHQPVEQLAMIRSIPNILLFRPCDFYETLSSYSIALKESQKPSVILATRQDLEQICTAENTLVNVNNGGYVLKEEKNAKITIIATGSEVSLAIKTKDILDKKGYLTRIVSMPCTQLFDAKTREYREQVLNLNTFIVSLEMGTTFGWDKYTNGGLSIGVDRFGLSAPAADIFKALGFFPEAIAEKILSRVKNN
ncbi:transketolase [Spiroplasma endosymbiont of Aspidapion aeneum]|uniref:transketolase n=1 Tax=Spiroplasma endosymbiont of Aspidapion aeneum TaxID=3066276 RepID=UPI00313D15FD